MLMQHKAGVLLQLLRRNFQEYFQATEMRWS